MDIRGLRKIMELIPTDIRRGQRSGSSLVARVIAIGVVAFAGCVRTDHFLIYSREVPSQVVLWEADFARAGLLIHIEGARPPGAGPFPTVIVHPEEEETAVAMHGVIWDLAAHGYVAIAADYERFLDGKYRRTTFAWRSAADIKLPIDVALSYPEVDPNRLGAVGFSEGAVLSLLMAAHYPDQFKAVVAYYPITDFPHWYAGERSGFSARVLFELARWQLRVDSEAPNADELQKMLRLASPYYMAEYVRAPVLLIHGANDTLALPEESERLAEQVKASGGTTEVLLLPGGTRLFNFRQTQQAAVAWDATLAWLARYLR